MTTPLPPIPVVGPPSATLASVQRAVPPTATDWFRRAVPALWHAGVIVGIDPVVLVAQCAHETGWGRFGRAVTPAHGNTAGIKIRDVPKGAADDDPNIHARFALGPDGTPWVGARAHADHLALYAGIRVPADTPDPRAVWVGPGTANFGTVRYVRDLGGKWAPAADYGLRIEATIRDLVAAVKGKTA